ncbi:hypothetical protein [Ralstonia solanacearum]|uniref:hypothetical protein n=1 Tax=Ralstonia solanacearum TaxID=305 RepID=UPI001E3DE1C9|nr:hypothetical protein [Ralstonia solanacearum]
MLNPVRFFEGDKFSMCSIKRSAQKCAGLCVKPNERDARGADPSALERAGLVDLYDAIRNEAVDQRPGQAVPVMARVPRAVRALP